MDIIVICHFNHVVIVIVVLALIQVSFRLLLHFEFCRHFNGGAIEFVVLLSLERYWAVNEVREGVIDVRY